MAKNPVNMPGPRQPDPPSNNEVAGLGSRVASYKGMAKGFSDIAASQVHQVMGGLYALGDTLAQRIADAVNDGLGYGSALVGPVAQIAQKQLVDTLLPVVETAAVYGWQPKGAVGQGKGGRRSRKKGGPRTATFATTGDPTNPPATLATDPPADAPPTLQIVTPPGFPQGATLQSGMPGYNPAAVAGGGSPSSTHIPVPPVQKLYPIGVLGGQIQPAPITGAQLQPIPTALPPGFTAAPGISGVQGARIFGNAPTPPCSSPLNDSLYKNMQAAWTSGMIVFSNDAITLGYQFNPGGGR